MRRWRRGGRRHVVHLAGTETITGTKQFAASSVAAGAGGAD
jgi:hypothetical protein